MKRARDRDSQGGCHVVTEEDTGVKQLQDKKCQALVATPEARKKSKKDSARDLLTPWFGVSGLQNFERINSFVLNDTGLVSFAFLSL